MKFLLSVLTALVFLSANAQKVKLISATKRDWSGGLAGHHGTNYVVTIECADTTIMPDTLWVDQNPTKINIDRHDTIFRKYNKKNRTVKYMLCAGESYIDPLTLEEFKARAKKTDSILVHRATKQYSGVASVTYMYMGKQYILPIASFTVLPALCYP